jgi:solute:Na+ symporter, SSS family
MLGIDYAHGLLYGAGVCLAYSSMGGLKLNIITDTFQFVVMVAGMGLLLGFSFHAAGGAAHMAAVLPKGHWNPWAFSNAAAVIVGALFSCLAAFCNSAHWQRISSARDLKEVAPSYYFSMPFTVFFVVSGILIGLCAAVAMPGVDKAASDTILFSFSQKVLPDWGAGIVAAAVLSTIMSSVDGLLVALSTVVLRQRAALAPNAKQLNITQSRLVTLFIAAVVFVVSYLYPHLMALGMIIYNLGLALIPAIFGALWNCPRTNVMLALRWGVILTALLYPLWDKNTFLAVLPACTIIVLWPTKK